MKITLTFQSDGDGARLIRAEWLPVGKRAGGDQEVTMVIGRMGLNWAGSVVTGWAAILNLASGPLRLYGDTEDEARGAVCEYLDDHGPWWFEKRPSAAATTDPLPPNETFTGTSNGGLM